MNNGRRRKKIIRAVVIAAGVLVAAGVAFKIFYHPKKLPAVTVETAATGKIVSTVTADGELKALNQVDISAEVVARIKKIYVKEGDNVTKGQLLCTLDDGELRSQRDLYRSQLVQTKAIYERGQALYAENLISAADFEERRTNYEVARARLEESENNLAKTRIYAPLAGRVVAVDVEEGETAIMGTTNNAGTVMFTLGDLSTMQAEVYVDETDVVAVAAGQPAVVTLDAMPNAEFQATVTSISYMPSTAATGTSSGATDVVEFKVVLDITGADRRLRPGMSVTAEITTAVRADVLTCPLQALGRQDINGKKRDTVFLLENGRVKLVPVTTGISDGARAEITGGLSAGQTVITGPYEVLRELHDVDAVAAEKTDEGGGKWAPKQPGGTSRSAMRAARMLRRR